MGEVGVAFPNDEASAEIVASRLRSAGIAARVDRGLNASYQTMPRNQITVLVDERHAKRAREMLGTTSRETSESVTLLRVAVIAVSAVIALGIVVIVMLLAH
jgi:anti-sigma-K factor RskA